MPGFHNPYNFVPTPPRTGLPEGLADGAPVGHHRWHEDRWSGEIDVHATVITPLLVPRDRPTGNEHREVDVAIGPDGRVDLAPTQIKGMLRAAYEAVTCSRFGVFTHDEPLGFRSASDGAAELLPALVLPGGRVRVLGRISGWRAAATVELWGHDRHRERRWPDVAHGDEVDAVIKRGTRSWEVVSLHPPQSQDPQGLADGYHLVAGQVHAPGPTAKDKHKDAVFVTNIRSDGLEQDPHDDLDRRESGKLVDSLTALISHQKEVHQHAGRDELTDRDGEPWEYLGDEPGKTAWSRHLYKRTTTTPPYLGPDTTFPSDVAVTCWAETANVDHSRKGDKKKISPHVRTVKRLRPVLISRLLYTHPPRGLLDPTLRPATTLDELSPADRVFGWTRTDRRDEPAENTAHRGQLRVVDLAPPSADDVQDTGPLTIPPLSTPKPGQGRFYLGTRDGRTMPSTTDRYGFFNPAEQRLRGRKVYPHHRGLEGRSLEELRTHVDYVPPIDDKGKVRDKKDTQNATLHQWVRPGATFTFTLHVTDLHPHELGALLWLLDPARCGRGDLRGRHRLGLGRPLGFGSVELTTAGTRLVTGDAIRDRLSLLDGPPAPVDPLPGLVEEFEKALPGWADPVLDALRHTFSGFGPQERVHYPRNRERSPVYDWFTNNEATHGPRLALPPLVSRDRLRPVDKEERK